ncbi:hypothetical protein ACLB2K_060304 [Fragaria x ananassa]
MAEFLLTFAAEGILTKVTSLAVQEITLVLGFKGDLAKLRDSFVNIEALLRDVNRSDVRGEAVKLWVKDLEDIAQKADDVLDEIGYEVLRRKAELQDQMKKKAAGPVGLVARIADATSQDIEVLDRETVSIFDSDEKRLIIGREEVVSDIVKTLIKSNYTEEDHLPVLAIVGMPGLGKTTLAKSIYHNSEIGKHFDEKIWVCVSTPFEVTTILRGILEYLDPEKAAVQRKEAICKFIRQKLEKKTYLLVLDDVWSEDREKWEYLENCLLTANGSRGTRGDQVARIMETLPRFDLRKLSDDECLHIMMDKAIPVGTALMSKEQEATAKDIAKKCGGREERRGEVGDLEDWNPVAEIGDEIKLWRRGGQEATKKKKED